MLNLDLIEEIGIAEDSELIDHYAIAAYTQGSDDPLILYRSPSYAEVAQHFDQIAALVGARSL
jgi:dihydrodipicolinate synthase/N-acetylneuraminate lyase